MDKYMLPRACASGFAFAAMIFLYVIISFSGQAVLSALSAGGFIYYAVSALFSVVAIFISLIIYSKISAEPVKVSRIFKPFNYLYLLLGVLIAAGMFMGLGFINTLFAEWIEKLGVTVSAADIPLETWGQYLAFTLVLGILPAIFEEVLFRGVIFGGVRGAGAFSAALLCSLCFSLYHCSLAQLIYQFIYGLFLCFLAYVSKSIIPGMLAHFLNNFAVLTFGFFGAEIDLFSPYIIAGGLILLAAAAAAMAFVYRKTCKASSDGNAEGNSGNSGGKQHNGGDTGGAKKDKGAVFSFIMPGGLFGIIICCAIIAAGVFAV